MGRVFVRAQVRGIVRTGVARWRIGRVDLHRSVEAGQRERAGSAAAVPWTTATAATSASAGVHEPVLSRSQPTTTGPNAASR